AGSDTTTHSESEPVTGLSPATTYHFRMVAHNTTGTTMGLDKTFRTTGPPTPTTEAATGVGGTVATLAGMVNPNGQATEYFFKWGETEAYGHETTKKSAGSGTSAVSRSEPLAGLKPKTTYHFRLFAKNASGEEEGVDRSFKTLGPPQATTGQATAIT